MINLKRHCEILFILMVSSYLFIKMTGVPGLSIAQTYSTCTYDDVFRRTDSELLM